VKILTFFRESQKENPFLDIYKCPIFIFGGGLGTRKNSLVIEKKQKNKMKIKTNHNSD
jgi:hypothetical protein